MALETFDRSDSAYFDWVRRNPDGYVVNTERRISPKYMQLHRATCGSITRYSGGASPGGFTERDYIKVCAMSVDELSRGARTYGGTLSAQCLTCRP
jgi:hypothetical protein